MVQVDIEGEKHMGGYPIGNQGKEEGTEVNLQREQFRGQGYDPLCGW